MQEILCAKLSYSEHDQLIFQNVEPVVIRFFCERMEGKAINHSAKMVPHHKNIIDLFCVCMRSYINKYTNGAHAHIHSTTAATKSISLLVNRFAERHAFCRFILPFACKFMYTSHFTHFDLSVCFLGVINSSASNMFHTKQNIKIMSRFPFIHSFNILCFAILFIGVYFYS